MPTASDRSDRSGTVAAESLRCKAKRCKGLPLIVAIVAAFPPLPASAQLNICFRYSGNSSYLTTTGLLELLPRYATIGFVCAFAPAAMATIATIAAKCLWLLGFSSYESWLRSAFSAATIRYDRLKIKQSCGCYLHPLRPNAKQAIRRSAAGKPSLCAGMQFRPVGQPSPFIATADQSTNSPSVRNACVVT